MVTLSAGIWFLLRTSQRSEPERISRPCPSPRNRGRHHLGTRGRLILGTRGRHPSESARRPRHERMRTFVTFASPAPVFGMVGADSPRDCSPRSRFLCVSDAEFTQRRPIRSQMIRHDFISGAMPLLGFLQGFQCRFCPAASSRSSRELRLRDRQPARGSAAGRSSSRKPRPTATATCLIASPSRRFRISATNNGPNRCHQNQTVLWQMSMPRACSRSSPFRSESGNGYTASRSGG